jgi:hypothetical protein
VPPVRAGRSLSRGLASVFIRRSSCIGTGEPKPSPVAHRGIHNCEVDGLLDPVPSDASCAVALRDSFRRHASRSRPKQVPARLYATTAPGAGPRPCLKVRNLFEDAHGFRKVRIWENLENSFEGAHPFRRCAPKSAHLRRGGRKSCAKPGLWTEPASQAFTRTAGPV